MKFLNPILLFVISFVIVSCSLEKSFVQKRKYNKGYYFSIAKKNKASFSEDVVVDNLEDAKGIANESFQIQEEVAGQPNEKVLIQDNLKNQKIESFKNTPKRKINESNQVTETNKVNRNNLRVLNQIIKKTNNNTTAVRPNSNLNDDLINLILAIVLVIAIIMLLTFLDGLLGGLLSLILLIVIVALLLSYFGII